VEFANYLFSRACSTGVGKWVGGGRGEIFQQHCFFYLLAEEVKKNDAKLFLKNKQDI
jgi:hypothetical protein